MKWCEYEQNDFPDREFTIVGDVEYHTRPGGSRHRAGPGNIEIPLPDEYPSPPPDDAYPSGDDRVGSDD